MLPGAGVMKSPLEAGALVGCCSCLGAGFACCFGADEAELEAVDFDSTVCFFVAVSCFGSCFTAGLLARDAQPFSSSFSALAMLLSQPLLL